ncbi:TRAP transporter small permease [Salibacterium salarium]|uniref:TRAP transporter small permease n=1 Tax=Salibacterium salarium TaxID=284579 RepID=A0A3R9QWE0_9BACI|nr:TRAP transporter small permease [Salibacterium salarium]RSL34838.1 TRAP transporter small permease [Salibacterium salarium]
MDKTRKVLDNFLLTLASVLILFLTIATLWQVFTRFVIGDPSVITEEVARFSLIWIAMLGAAYGFGSGEHLSLDFIREKFEGSIYKWVRIGIDVVVLLFALFVLVLGGFTIVNATLTESSPILGISMGAIYSILPVSGIFIIIYQVLNVLDRKRMEGREQS